MDLHQNSPPILHRDLTSKNILLDLHGRCKVADFGLSQQYNPKSKALPGCVFYTGPEILKAFTGTSFNPNYSLKSDVYSFGIVAWETLAEQHPFKGLGLQQLVEEVCQQKKRPALQSL